MDKELFLREKMYEIYFFIIKLLVTFSSSALAFSIGILSLSGNTGPYEWGFWLIVGWALILLSIILSLVGLFNGLNLTYNYYNNIVEKKPEIDTNTTRKEVLIQVLMVASSVSVILGIISFMAFIINNL